MVQTEQGLSDAADPTPRSRRNLPRVKHACQRCRGKKAKCDQQQPCLNCVKHAVDCEYGVRKRSGRKKQQAHGSIIELPGGRPSSAVRSRSLSRPDEGEVREDAHTTELSGTSFAPRTSSTNGLDVVGDINQRTQGTEFYGTSSNFVLLNQLFAFARQHDSSRYVSSDSNQSSSHLFPTNNSSHTETTNQNGNGFATLGEHSNSAGLTGLSHDRVSIINLLSNEEVLSPPSRPKTPPGAVDGRPVDSSTFLPQLDRVTNVGPRSLLRQSPLVTAQATRPELTTRPLTPSHTSANQNHVGGLLSSTQVSKRRLEQAYIHIFFHNLHHLHPMLNQSLFEKRCERDIWNTHTATERQRGSRHFLALYNIVIAVGALISGRTILEELGQDVQACAAELAEPETPEQRISSQMISRTYFRKSKDRLGDTSAVCSLESAQTLLLMSLYCQNSHMPHRCYMYCGQAVRTALAIGLANEPTSMSIEDRKAARRTWWCIYSHEIDMSCSSGRRDSLRKPHNYQITLPLVRDRNVEADDAPEAENTNVTMINEMVRFAAILRRISKELYHDAKGLTLHEKSTIAKELDGLLGEWKSNLPEWLDFSKISFREEEWAGKQKLVLHLRYLNARILAHRLFLAPSTNYSQLDMSDHIARCLDAARETIRVLHDAYAHRHYFRTWWYNSTYTLYAGMIVLYVIMLQATALCSEDLLNDVVKAQTILQSMQEATVALRSAELLREGLEIARSTIQRDATNSSARNLTDQVVEDHAGQPEVDDMASNTSRYLPQTTFATSRHGADPGSLFASLIDPGVLQDFTTGLNPFADMATSTFLFDDLYNNEQGFYSTSSLYNEV